MPLRRASSRARSPTSRGRSRLTWRNSPLGGFLPLPTSAAPGRAHPQAMSRSRLRSRQVLRAGVAEAARHAVSVDVGAQRVEAAPCGKQGPESVLSACVGVVGETVVENTPAPAPRDVLDRIANGP